MVARHSPILTLGRVFARSVSTGQVKTGSKCGKPIKQTIKGEWCTQDLGVVRVYKGAHSYTFIRAQERAPKAGPTAPVDG